MISGKDLIKQLEKKGFKIVRQRGSHVRLVKGTIKLTIPLHKELKKGTLHKILKQAQN